MKWPRVVILYIALHMVMAAGAAMTIYRAIYKMTILRHFIWVVVRAKWGRARQSLTR